MAKRFKQYRLRMTEKEFEDLNELSKKLNMPKSTIIRLLLKSAMMKVHAWTGTENIIRQSYTGGFTHAVMYIDTDSIKYTDKGEEDVK